ncbi:hypothetical protein KL943_002072 [Ogataea angusta]|nr:hypothetical protein KL943_002072 [Ogataea angusta]
MAPECPVLVNQVFPLGSSLFITDDTFKPHVWEDSVFLSLESEGRYVWPNALINRILQDGWKRSNICSIFTWTLDCGADALHEMARRTASELELRSASTESPEELLCSWLTMSTAKLIKIGSKASVRSAGVPFTGAFAVSIR